MAIAMVAAPVVHQLLIVRLLARKTKGKTYLISPQITPFIKWLERYTDPTIL